MRKFRKGLKWKTTENRLAESYGIENYYIFAQLFAEEILCPHEWKKYEKIICQTLRKNDNSANVYQKFNSKMSSLSSRPNENLSVYFDYYYFFLYNVHNFSVLWISLTVYVNLKKCFINFNILKCDGIFSRILDRKMLKPPKKNSFNFCRDHFIWRNICVCA